MYFAYVSPEGSDIYSTLEEKDRIVKIQNDFETLQCHYTDCHLLLVGPLNARTKDLLDYLPDDNLSHIFRDTDYDCSTFCTPIITLENLWSQCVVFLTFIFLTGDFLMIFTENTHVVLMRVLV